MFQFATDPASLRLPVRQLEVAAGVSKSMAAQARNKIIAEGLFERRGSAFQPSPLLGDRLLTGYSQTLRPKLLRQRFSYHGKTPEAFLDRLAAEAPTLAVRYALTGGAAAHLLQNYYRGRETAIFVDQWSRTAQDRLRLLPDGQGALTVLRAFGEVVYWREVNGHTIAPPWLIYAELLTSGDARAHEAAEELRRELLA